MADMVDKTSNRLPRWIQPLLQIVGAFAALSCLYVLSLGPVLAHYKTHPSPLVPGTRMMTFKFPPPAASNRGAVHYPAWIAHAYSPAFQLMRTGNGQSGLAHVYRGYLAWWVDRERKCLSNLRVLDEAKRKWAAELQKTDGDVPFAEHIFDALPDRSPSRCPTGGDYSLNPVGARPSCSFHGDGF